MIKQETNNKNQILTEKINFLEKEKESIKQTYNSLNEEKLKILNTKTESEKISLIQEKDILQAKLEVKITRTF